MKLCIFNDNLLEGGGVTHLRKILPSLIENFDEVVLTSSLEGYQNLRNFSSNKFIKRVQIFTAKDFDILFAPGGILPLSLCKRKFTMFRNSLIVDKSERFRFFPTNLYFRYRILRIVQLLSFVRADKVIFLNQSALELYRKETKFFMFWIRPEVISHGVDYVFDLQREDVPPDTIRLLSVGNVSKYKNLRLLFNGLDLVRHKNHEFSLTIVGGYKTDRDFSEVYGYSVRSDFDVNMLGKIAHSEVLKTYLNHDILLFLSGCENLPNILLEAMAAGMPVIVLDKPPMNCYITNPYFIVESDPRSLSLKLSYLLDNKHLLTQEGLDNRKKIRMLSWKRCSEETIKLLKEA